MVSLFVMAVSVLVQVLVIALALRLTTRWAKIERRSWKRIAIAAIAYCVVAVATGVIGAIKEDPNSSQQAQIVNGIAWLIVQLAATFLAINLVLGSTFVQTLKAWLGPIAASLAMTGLMLGLIKPFVVETYASPSNAMAPALRGDHLQMPCPACGGNALLSAVSLGFDGKTDYSTGICADCYTPIGPRVRSDTPGLKLAPKQKDRFSANKLRMPARWDITVYLTPDREFNYVHRVVGLPGETVQMQNNQLLINGAPVIPPANCAKIRFGELAGSAGMRTQGLDTPVRLGKDEYFVLGDNQSHSLDSRFSGPVTRDRIVGVVDLIYWPPGRMQILP